MDREVAEGAPRRLAVLAYRSRVGGGLRAVEAGTTSDIGHRELVAGGKAPRPLEPGLRPNVAVAHVEAVGAPVGDHPTIEAAQPEIEIHRVGGEDDAEPVARMGPSVLGRVGGAIDHGGVGGPPAHVAGALVEVAVDDLDGIEGEIDAALRPRLGGEPSHRLGQGIDAAPQIGGQRSGQLFDLARDVADLLSHHREASAVHPGV